MLGAIWGHLGVPPNLGAKWPPCPEEFFYHESLTRHEQEQNHRNLKCQFDFTSVCVQNRRGTDGIQG